MADVEIPNPDDLAELKEKSFTRGVALITAVIAVILAVCSLGGSNAGKDMMLAQQQASNAWAYYQAKAMREHLYKLEKSRLETEILARGAAVEPALGARLQEVLKQAADETERYGREKKEIEDKARALELERDTSMAKDPYFDYAEVMLQIAIVMASIAILTGSRPVFYFGLTLASAGTFLTLDGYLMFLAIPGLG